MKKVIIITYDLMTPGKNYEALLQRIKGNNAWAKLGGSSYLIITENSPTQIRDHLKSVLDVNDKLFVSVINTPAAWTGLSEQVANWIRNNLK